MIEGWDESYEAPEDMDRDMRALVMTDPDHRRWYGRDIRDKIEAAGLIFSEFVAVEPDVTKFGVARGEKLFFGTAPDR